MIEKLDMKTPDFTNENIAQIAALFPNCLTETKDENGNLKKAIDFDLLKQELSENIVDGVKERYSLTWPGKKEALVTANKPINKTFRPDVEDSVNFDTTQNLYIEGDNLEALKLLQESYLNKIKMIYIDPPYNTGKDFVYKDNFTGAKDDELEASGQIDEEGGRLVSNPETNGRFHSDWLSMIYPRLKLARNLLKEDGVIFISIGPVELNTLITVSNEVFGESNKISIVGRLAKSGGNKGKFFSPNIEYVLVYAKQIDLAHGFRAEMDESLIKKVYTKIESLGIKKGEKYRAMGLYQSSLDPMRGCINQRYYIKAPDGCLLIPNGNVFPEIKAEGEKIKPKTGEDGVWRWTYPKYQEELEKGNIEFSETKNKVLVDENGEFSKWNINTKIWLKDRQEEGQLPNDFISKYENRHSAKELKELGIVFDFPKPSDLIKYFSRISNTSNNDIILDFFSGSGSTAHAIIKANSEDDQNRKFIMVQLQEEIEDKNFSTICELGKERIRRAGKKIVEESGKTDLDIGFRVLKIDSSNMNDVYYSPDEITQDSLFDVTVDNIKTDRKPLDLLFQVLLDSGVDLTLPIRSEKILGKEVYFVDENVMIACFEDSIDELLVTEIAKMNDILKVVFKDSSFKSDDMRINVEQIFKQYSPDTDLKVI